MWKRSSFRPHPHLLEINTWAWLEQFSAGLGRRVGLADVADAEWDTIASLGFDFVWLMGIWERSPLGRQLFRTNPASFAEFDRALPGWKLQQVVGSPYAVRNYRPDPRIGTWKDVDLARRKLRERGIRLILDFVVNHTALDHPWVAAHAEYYVSVTEQDYRRDPGAFFLFERPGGQIDIIAHGRDPYFPPWRDSAQLNYFHPGMRDASLAALRTIARHCDGVRCDMAMLVLNDVFARNWGHLLSGAKPPEQEFWTQAVAALPDFIWLAEVYWDLEARLQGLGMQFTYDKRLYDSLRDSPAADVRLHLKAAWSYQKSMARFLENHDERRAASVFGKQRLPALATLLATLPGMRFYHQGQLDGREIHLPIPLAFAAEEPPDPAVRSLYEKLLRLSNEEVFHTGGWKLFDVRPADSPRFENLVSYQWRSPKAWKLVVVNLGGESSEGHVEIGNEIEPGKQYNFYDHLSDANSPWAGSDLARGGLYVKLEGNRAHLFDVAAT